MFSRPVIRPLPERSVARMSLRAPRSDTLDLKTIVRSPTGIWRHSCSPSTTVSVSTSLTGFPPFFRVLIFVLRWILSVLPVRFSHVWVVVSRTMSPSRDVALVTW